LLLFKGILGIEPMF